MMKSLKYYSKIAVLKHRIVDPELTDDFWENHLELIPREQLRMIGPFINHSSIGLIFSALNGFVEAFLYFQELGALSWDVMSAMMAAAKNGHIEIVKFCQKLVADDPENFYQLNNTMNRAAEGGHYDIVNLCLEWGADDIEWAMCGASEGGNIEMIKFFRELGARNFKRAMEIAAQKGHIDIVKQFVEKHDEWNVEWNVEDYDDALKFAACEGRVGVMEYLESCGARNFDEALKLASRCCHSDACLEQKLKNGSS